METSQKPSTAVLAEGAAWLLAALFAYTAVSKVYDWQGTKLAMYNQVFPVWVAEVLLYALPMMELLVVIALLLPALRRIGFLTSSLLLAVFTVYVTWIWLGFAQRVPCSCGGVLSSLGWGEHLVFNLVFLAIAGYGLWVERRKNQWV